MLGIAPSEVGDVQHPSSLFLPYATPITREDIKGIPHAFILNNVLSVPECRQWIESSSEAGYRSLVGTFPASYRSNERVIAFSQPAAQSIFKRIVPYGAHSYISHLFSLNAADCDVHPIGPGGEGLWSPFGLNECLKFARYTAGCKFAPHIDGPWTPATDLQSIYTVILYLNGASSFAGGETNFLEKQPDGGMRVLVSVQPRAGSALVFKHELLHEGAELHSGVKYIVRSELIFRRQDSVLHLASLFSDQTEAIIEEIAGYYLESEVLLQKGDTSGFVSNYLKAIELQSWSSRAVQQQPLPLPIDLVGLIFEHLSLLELRKCMHASKSWYRAARSNSLWMRKVARDLPDYYKQVSADLSVDWLRIYIDSRPVPPREFIIFIDMTPTVTYFWASDNLETVNTAKKVRPKFGAVKSEVTIYRSYRKGAWHSGTINVDRAILTPYPIGDFIMPKPVTKESVVMRNVQLFGKEGGEHLRLFLRAVAQQVTSYSAFRFVFPRFPHPKDDSVLLSDACAAVPASCSFAPRPLVALRVRFCVKGNIFAEWECMSGIVITIGHHASVCLLRDLQLITYARMDTPWQLEALKRPKLVAQAVKRMWSSEETEKSCVVNVIVTGESSYSIFRRFVFLLRHRFVDERMAETFCELMSNLEHVVFTDGTTYALRTSWATELQAELLQLDMRFRVRNNVTPEWDFVRTAAAAHFGSSSKFLFPGNKFLMFDRAKKTTLSL